MDWGPQQEKNYVLKTEKIWCVSFPLYFVNKAKCAEKTKQELNQDSLRTVLLSDRMRSTETHLDIQTVYVPENLKLFKSNKRDWPQK